MPAPIVIAHRGASAYRPEHTIAGYALAIELGADYIEPDLVITRDGVLVARHDPELSATTDVAAHGRFAHRRTTRIVDGTPATGWFVEDFTLAELNELRAIERRPALRPASAAFDGRFAIPTFDQILDLVATARAGGRRVGVYPELKHPARFAQLGLALEAPLLAGLTGRRAVAGPAPPVFIQSFDAACLRRLREATDLPLVQLLAGAEPAAAGALREIAEYARGIGVDKRQMSPRHGSGAGALVEAAHDTGLIVHAWTFEPEERDARAAIDAALRTGIDGVFADAPDEAVAARAALAT